MKIIVVLICSCIFSQILVAQEEITSLQKALQRFFSFSGLEHAAISFEVVDLSTGESLASHQPKMALPTASIMKLFSTAGAFELIDPYYIPKTRVYFNGEIDSLGVLNGDIWVRGGGDPSLGSRYFEKHGEQRNFLNTWVTKVLDFGIKKVNGSVIVDASEFGYEGVPEGWSWGDMGNYYGTGPSGMVFMDNTTFFDFSTSKKVGDSTWLNCMRPHVEGLNFRNEIKSASVRGDNSYIFGAPFSMERFGKGSLPLNKNSFEVKASIPDPEWLLAQEFQMELAQFIPFENAPRGVRNFSAEEREKIDYSKMKECFSWDGKMLQTIAYWTNQKSVNLFAEQLVCLTSYKKHNNGSISEGINVMNNFWRPIVGNGFVMADGSGLARKNAASANHFVKMLAYMEKSKHWEDFKQTLPIAGKSGTLSTVCRGQFADGKIFAKSGTMARIKSYTGYVESNSGKRLAFALIVNNHTCTNFQLVKEMEKLFNEMARY